MKTGMWIGLLLVGSTCAAPWVSQAQIFMDPCCQRTRPVVQTHVREEKVTTYRDVAETRYRQECVIEQTPVTTYEDRVETVWVPQQVTKKVARTVMVPQAKSRTVPYQVLQRIPETTTRLVPYQTVHHVLEPAPLVYAAPTGPVISHGWPSPAAPQSASAMPHRAPPLAPAAKDADGWQTIPPRSASATRYGDYEADSSRSAASNGPAFRRSSWRGNVPGAAAAWNYGERTYR